MTGKTKTTEARQSGPTRAPLKDQPEGSPEVVDRELGRKSAPESRKPGETGSRKAK